MKKTILFAALLASTATFANAQDGGSAPRGPRPERKVELSKLPEQMPQELKDKMKEADKNGDGVLEGKELQGLFPFQGNAPRFGGFGPGPQGPGFGPRFGEAFKDGKIELAKLPEQMPQERKDALKAADKDGDGFLTGEEMRGVFAFQAPGPQGQPPRFDGPGFGAPRFGEAFKDGLKLK
jgi:hypothetical protein